MMMASAALAHSKNIGKTLKSGVTGAKNLATGAKDFLGHAKTDALVMGAILSRNNTKTDANGNKLYNYSLIAGFFEQASSPSSTQVFNESNTFETSNGSWSPYNSFSTTGITGLPQLTYTGIDSNVIQFL